MASNRHHLIRSHAEESNVPGTVDLNVRAGDDAVFGQALFPVPAQDPNDPLQWQTWKKMAILVICSLYSFLSNTALLGPSVYITIFAEQFDITPTKASGLISYPNICYGVGTLITVPAYLKFGRRPVMLVSIAAYLAGLIGCSQCTTYSGLMTARIIQTLASSVCEALPVQLVNDIFFLHERGTKLGIYTVCLCWGSTGPLYAGYMLAGGYSWRLFFYVESALAGALLLAAFLFVEETSYDRISAVRHPDDPFNEKEPEKLRTETEQIEVRLETPRRRSFLASLRPWSMINHDQSYFITAVRSFSYFLVPSVLWVITTYGIYIGLGALVFNYTFPIKIVAAPYNWSQENSGLIALGNIIGYALALPFVASSDWLAAKLTRRNGGIREAEMRLGVLLPAMVVAPAGLIVYGMTAQRDLHWIGYFAGVTMVDWGSFAYFTFTLAYSVDSYNANMSESLIAMCIGKQLISFGFGEKLLDWVEQSGYAVIISGAFCAVLLVNNVLVLVFIFFGKRIRTFYAKTWLATMHRGTVRDGETH